LLLGEVWTLDERGEHFVERVAGTRGVYVDKEDVLTMELFDYVAVLQGLQKVEASRG
jgi:hypothetical protein